MRKRTKIPSQYYVTYERDGKKGYVASAPAIAGCVVYGKTLPEAHQNISSAIKECLEVIHQFHKETPKETIEPKEVLKLSFVKVRQREYVKA